MTDFASIDLLAEKLQARGYSVKKLKLNNQNYTQFTSPSGKVWLTANEHIRYPFNTASIPEVSKKKNKAYELAARTKVTIPKTVLVRGGQKDLAQAKALLSSAPLIVKPNEGSLSNGLTVGITGKRQLTKAIKLARQFDQEVLVQQQVDGQEIRFTVLNGKVVTALLRQTPQVVGDGKSSLRQLIDRENEARAKIAKSYVKYPKLEAPLINLGALNLDQVVPKNQVFVLGHTSMVRSGASVYNILSKIHPSYLETVTKLASQLGKGFVAVDMFVQDYSKPQTARNYAFIEFNMAPVLKLFYSCRDENNYDILSQLIPLIDKALL